MTTDYQMPPQTSPMTPPPPMQAPMPTPMHGAVPPVPGADRSNRYVDDPRRKSVMWAVILSAMPGLGHVYVGYYREAFRNIAVVCLLVLLLFELQQLAFFTPGTRR